eukprot:3542748-Amphidinium_carterae.1
MVPMVISLLCDFGAVWETGCFTQKLGQMRLAYKNLYWTNCTQCTIDTLQPDQVCTCHVSD